MSGIADPRVGLEAAHMLRDAIPAEPDLDLLLVDHDLDLLAHMLMGCAVSNGVDVYKAIGTDAPLQAAGANSQGACRQGSQGLSLVTLEANGGPFSGCAVDTPIGDLDHPSSPSSQSSCRWARKARQ